MLPACPPNVIVIQGLEGPEEWSRPRRFYSVFAATALLCRRAAQLAADYRERGEIYHGGYWKHRILILDESGDIIFSGRYDLYPLGRRGDEGTPAPDLAKWMDVFGVIAPLAP